jgi:CMP-N,N'-diacetyllegionaminic acid synthase
VYKGKSILAVLPARGGSKGVPRKNLRNVGGKPLIAWTIEQAAKSAYLDRFVLSSEDEEIIAVARSLNLEVPFVRPEALAGDNVPAYLPVIDMAEKLPGYDYTVTLQPSVPLRTVEDIDGCIELCIDSGAPSCVSLTVPDKSPYWMYQLEKNNRMLPLIEQPDEGELQRQDLPDSYVLNGAVYVADTQWLLLNRKYLSPQTVGYPMPQERSLDIDTETDLAFFNFLVSK